MLFADKAHFAVADPAERRAETTVLVPERTRRMIPHGDSLFTPGAPRAAAYRVEAGALCHYVNWPDGSHDVIEFAFPGDIVGLGSLGEHVSTAQAMVDTVVVPISADELDRAIVSDAALATRMASASDREFEYLRRRALQPGPRPALNRVAAYLVAVATSACRSGETHIASGEDGVKALSQMLEMPADSARNSMIALQRDGLISERDGSIVIDDISGLEAVVDA